MNDFVEKRCWRCTKIKTLDDFYKNKGMADGHEQICKTCRAEIGKNRRVKRASEGLCWCGRQRKENYNTCSLHVQKSRDWGRANKREKHAVGVIWRQTNRDKVFNHYGTSCACCGEEEQKFLTIDHVDGGGTRHRKEVGGGVVFYSWLIRHNFPEGYQTLCQNCNSGRFRNGGVCPHVQLRLDQAAPPAPLS